MISRRCTGIGRRQPIQRRTQARGNAIRYSLTEISTVVALRQWRQRRYRRIRRLRDEQASRTRHTAPGSARWGSRTARGFRRVRRDGGSAHAYDWNDWPTHYTFSDGTDLGLTMVYRYDANDFSNDRLPNGSDVFEDSSTNRRKELGLTLRKKGVYDAIVDFEYEATPGSTSIFRVTRRQYLGRGLWRVPLRLLRRRPSASRAYTTHQGRYLSGTGAAVAGDLSKVAAPAWIGCSNARSYIANLGYYWGQDLLGDNDGTTLAGRHRMDAAQAGTATSSISASPHRARIATTPPTATASPMRPA